MGIMPELTGYWQVSLHSLVAELGPDRVQTMLSQFCCPLNKDVERFLREKAIEFSRQSIASTYLVFSSYQGTPVLVGYYALANKVVTIKDGSLSSNWKRRLRKFATHDDELKRFCVALPLIGQLGKNYAHNYDQLISGDALLGMACDKVRSIQLMSSGKMAYLECEDIPRLIEFYERNGFFRFANRNLDRDELDEAKTPYLVQMIKYFQN